MWWRVELDKTGAILSCEHAAMGFTGSRYIRFVEAETKHAACTDAKTWWLLRSERRAGTDRQYRARRKAEGTCINGKGHGPPEPGKTRCANCSRLKAEGERRRHERSSTGGPTDHRRSELDLVERRKATLLRGRRVQQKIIEFAGGNPAYGHWRTLCRLRKLGAAGFEAWLIARIPNYDALMAKEQGADPGSGVAATVGQGSDAAEPLAAAAE